MLNVLLLVLSLRASEPVHRREHDSDGERDDENGRNYERDGDCGCGYAHDDGRAHNRGAVRDHGRACERACDDGRTRADTQRECLQLTVLEVGAVSFSVQVAVFFSGFSLQALFVLLLARAPLLIFDPKCFCNRGVTPSHLTKFCTPTASYSG